MSNIANIKKAYDAVNNLSCSEADKDAVRDIIEALTGEKTPKKKLSVASREYRQTYWCVGDDGRVMETDDKGRQMDDQLHAFGNYFLNHEDAVTHAKRLRTFNRICAFARQVGITGPQDHLGYRIAYWKSDRTFEVVYSQVSEILPTFRTREDAQLVLDSLDEEDLKVLRGEV